MQKSHILRAASLMIRSYHQNLKLLIRVASVNLFYEFFSFVSDNDEKRLNKVQRVKISFPNKN
jgi:hypothetical protein